MRTRFRHYSTFALPLFVFFSNFGSDLAETQFTELQKLNDGPTAAEKNKTSNKPQNRVIDSSEALTQQQNSRKVADGENSTTKNLFSAPKGSLCEDGWIPYLDSCYYVENRTMSLPKAEKRCSSHGATLFIANSQEEFNEIARQAPRNFWTWIGLAQFEHQSAPTWQTTSGIDVSKMKWLINPFSSAANGWSSVSGCVAHYNGDAESTRYLYFYPCDSGFNSICERNFTFTSALARQAQQFLF